MDYTERRQYKRSDHFHMVAKYSRDQKTWADAVVNNLSSGGLQLCTEDRFETGDTIWFDLTIQGFFSEFEIQTKAEVKNVKITEDSICYGVVFLGLSHDKKIRIDENVNHDRPFGGGPYFRDY